MQFREALVFLQIKVFGVNFFSKIIYNYLLAHIIIHRTIAPFLAHGVMKNIIYIYTFDIQIFYLGISAVWEFRLYIIVGSLALENLGWTCVK